MLELSGGGMCWRLHPKCTYRGRVLHLFDLSRVIERGLRFCGRVGTLIFERSSFYGQLKYE